MNHPETIVTVVCCKLAKIASLHAKRWIVEKDILEYWVLRCLKLLIKYCRHPSILSEKGTICLRPNIANLSLCQLQAPHLSGRNIASVMAWYDLQLVIVFFFRPLGKRLSSQDKLRSSDLFGHSDWWRLRVAVSLKLSVDGFGGSFRSPPVRYQSYDETIFF